MKSLITIAIIMLMVGYLFADVTTHLINKRKPKNDIGRKYYPVLYKIKEHSIYPIHNKNRIKSYERGSNGTQVTQIRNGYKVKK
jgi:hypothetical protein